MAYIDASQILTRAKYFIGHRIKMHEIGFTPQRLNVLKFLIKVEAILEDTGSFC